MLIINVLYGRLLFTELINGTKCFYSTPLPITDSPIIDNEVCIVLLPMSLIN